MIKNTPEQSSKTHQEFILIIKNIKNSSNDHQKIINAHQKIIKKHTQLIKTTPKHRPAIFKTHQTTIKKSTKTKTIQEKYPETINKSRNNHQKHPRNHQNTSNTTGKTVFWNMLSEIMNPFCFHSEKLPGIVTS